MFAGPAGVGKTRLVSECRGLATDIGFAVVRITPTRTAAGIPFGAVAPFLPSGREPSSEVRLLRSAVRAIADTAAGRPLLVTVDDAHLLDDGSATVIAQLVAERQAFVCAAMRAGDPVPDAVVGLWKEGLARRIDLEPLSPAEIAALVERALGGPPESATQQLLWQQTGGNPLFLREVLLAATTTGALRERGGIWRLAPGPITSTRLVELVEQRLRELAADERQALTLVAFGEPVDVGVIEGVCGAEAIEALERQALIVVEPSGARIEARLANLLYGDAIRSATSVLQARAAYRMLIRAQGDGGARRRDDDLRLASWTLESGDALDPAAALDAAGAAAARSAFALAERFARRAVDGGGGLDATLLLSEFLAYQGKFDETEHVLAAVEDDLTTDEQVMAFAVNRAALLHTAGRDDEAFAVHHWAIARVGSAAIRSELIFLLAWHELLNGDPVGALHRIEGFLDGPVTRATVRAAIVAGLALPLLGRTSEALALSERHLGRYVELHSAPQVVPAALHAVFRAFAFSCAGRPREALAISEAAHRASVEDGATRVQAWAAMELARAHLLLGNSVDAARFAREGAVLTGELRRGVSGRWCLTLVSLAESMGGDAAAAADALQAGDRLARAHAGLMDAEVDRAHGWVAAAAGDTASARDHFAAAAARAATTGEAALEVTALHDLARLGAPDAAAPRLGELSALVDGELVTACAADAAARRDRDPSALQAAADRFESLGMLLHTAESLVAAGAALAGAGDLRAAAACERRARAAAQRCNGAATPALASLMARADRELTAGEREVAVLAAAGLASRVIAERLFVSVRTVENRLQRAYRKLGVRDRAGLADALSGNG